MEEEVIKGRRPETRGWFSPELVFLAALGLRWCVGSSPVAVIGGGCLAVAHGPLPEGLSCCRAQTRGRTGSVGVARRL